MPRWSEPFQPTVALEMERQESKLRLPPNACDYDTHMQTSKSQFVTAKITIRKLLSDEFQLSRILWDSWSAMALGTEKRVLRNLRQVLL